MDPERKVRAEVSIIFILPRSYNNNLLFESSINTWLFEEQGEEEEAAQARLFFNSLVHYNKD